MNSRAGATSSRAPRRKRSSSSFAATGTGSITSALAKRCKFTRLGRDVQPGWSARHATLSAIQQSAQRRQDRHRQTTPLSRATCPEKPEQDGPDREQTEASGTYCYSHPARQRGRGGQCRRGPRNQQGHRAHHHREQRHEQRLREYRGVVPRELRVAEQRQPQQEREERRSERAVDAPGQERDDAAPSINCTPGRRLPCRRRPRSDRGTGGNPPCGWYGTPGRLSLSNEYVGSPRGLVHRTATYATASSPSAHGNHRAACNWRSPCTSVRIRLELPVSQGNVSGLGLSTRRRPSGPTPMVAGTTGSGPPAKRGYR